MPHTLVDGTLPTLQAVSSRQDRSYSTKHRGNVDIKLTFMSVSGRKGAASESAIHAKKCAPANAAYLHASAESLEDLEGSGESTCSEAAEVDGLYPHHVGSLVFGSKLLYD